jgi:HEAT repeat protein
MVRDKKLYPLKDYLTAADQALERNPRNLRRFTKAMSDSDAGIRYWAVVGLHLLGDDAAPATETLRQALKDDEDEVRIMAAWTLVNLGQADEGLGCLRDLVRNGSTAELKLYNVLDWMGDSAAPVVEEVIAAKPKKAMKVVIR